ncbi:MAG: cytochrome c oxidase assembly protein [Gemmatimonadales bacterium]
MHARLSVRARTLALFAAGCIVLAAALLPPLHELSERLFTAHMIQHELLMAVAAPLLVLGAPGAILLRAFPVGARRAVASVIRSRPCRAVWRAATRPFDAWLLHAAAIWLWHVPALFERALENDAMHAAQHASFLVSALLFWWSVFHPRRRAALGAAIIYLFTTAVHTAALGALMATARVPWYPDYANHAAAWGLTALQDQQLGGLVMWIPASGVYLLAALYTLRRWLRASEWSVAQRERVTFA